MPKGTKPSHGNHKPSITIPHSNSRSASVSGSASSPRSPLTPTTPKTPADEGLEFFSSAPTQGETPILVYELRLDPDGGPNKDRQVNCALTKLCPSFDNEIISTYVYLPRTPLTS